MQGVLCPSCGAMAPAKASECPECGTSLFSTDERTHLRARIDDIAGRTIDDSSDEELPQKRTAPHQAISFPPVGRRQTGPGSPLQTVADSTIPFKGGGGGYGGPIPEGMRETIVPPPASPGAAPAARRSAPRTQPATERSPAVRLDAATPQDGFPQVSSETQPGEKGPYGKKDPLIGTRLGEYVVEERVGIGGMGIVYRAMQPLIGNSVAIKVLRPDVIADETDLQRFLGEARTVNSIRHRSIISIFGASDTPDGRKYLVMEYLEGESLETRLQREGRIPSAEALPILEDVLSALAAAHAANVVHRDLKPANVFLVHQSDGRPWVKLLDFGLARGANRQDVSRIAGTPDYISPEHARGKPAGPPSDLYAFGILAFHLLTGRLPFVGNTPMEVMEGHVHHPPPVPKELDDSIPQAMSDLILRLLDKEPQNRPDAKTVKADLKAAAKELRNAATQIGPRPVKPSAPRVGGDADAAALHGETVLRGAATPIMGVNELKPDPRLERRALEADRAAEGSWLARNWPWLAGGVAVVWLMGIALYLLLQRPPPPDLRERPIVPSQKAPAPAQPDLTGGLDQANEPKAEPEPAKVEPEAAPAAPLGAPPSRPTEKPRKKTPGKK